MSLWKSLAMIFVIGLVLWLTNVGAGILAGIILIFLPLDLLGDLALYFTILISILALGTVGKFTVRYAK